MELAGKPMLFIKASWTVIRQNDDVLFSSKYPKTVMELADKPDSVMDSHSSRPSITQWLQQPTRFQREPRHTEPYLVLLRVEFTSPLTVTRSAVRSYRTISPLPPKRLP